MKRLILGIMLLALSAHAQSEWGAKPEYTRAVYDEAMEYLAKGRQKDAEWLLEEACSEVSDSRRLWFLKAVMQRSRVEWELSHDSFKKAFVEEDATYISKASAIVVTIDGNQAIGPGFQALEELINEHPEDMLLRWLYGIEARFHGRHIVEAERQFKKILREWKIAPVMVHQTYAKLLTSDLGKPKQALEHRLLAVELEPEPWSYQGLANTYKKLERYKKADQVYEKLIEMKPYNFIYWIQWGNCRFYMEDYKGAFQKYAKADQLKPTEISPLLFQGRCLEKMDQAEAGYLKYEEALKRKPTHPQTKAYITHSKLYGYGTDADIEVALEICSRQGRPAIDQLRDQVRLADKSENALAPEKSAPLLKHLKKLARDNAGAGYNLGMIYRYGIGVAEDEEAAMEWFRKAAELGHKIAKREISPPE